MRSEAWGAKRHEQECYRQLDSLARYYNSQITTHVGYLLTSSAFVSGSALASLSLILARSLPSDPVWGTIEIVCRAALVDGLIVIVGWFFLGFFPLLGRFLPIVPVSFKYLWGRTQLYEFISQIVWEHMELTIARPLEKVSQDYASKLRNRMRREGPYSAIISLFEARLFVSKCREEGIRFDDDRIRQNLRHFDIAHDEINILFRFMENVRYYARPTFGRVFSSVDCLTLAWENQIRGYLAPNQDNEEVRWRGVLLVCPKDALDGGDCSTLSAKSLNRLGSPPKWWTMWRNDMVRRILSSDHPD